MPILVKAHLKAVSLAPTCVRVGATGQNQMTSDINLNWWILRFRTQFADEQNGVPFGRLVCGRVVANVG